ncbi:MAG TPA: AMP-binding protein [Gaiellales bacterium]
MNANLAQILDSAAEAHGDRVAMVVEGGETATFAEFARRAGAVAAWLGECGVVPGDRVALRLPNGPGYLAAYFGALRAGAIVVPLNPLLAPPEVAHRVEASGARVVIGDEPLPEPSGSAAAMAERAPGDAAVLLYTSGTTGAAKGAVLTHAGLRDAARNAASVLAYAPSDVILGAAPFSHVLGQSAGMNAAVLAGARIAVPGRFDPPRALAEMARTGTTVLLGVPAMCVGLTAAARESVVRPPLRIAHIGGAPLPAEVGAAFEACFGCPIHEGYGLTELSGMAAAQPVGRLRVTGSVGVPVGGVEMRLRAADGSMCPPEAVGEVQFRGGTVIPGYWRDDAATRAAIDRHGWLSTGDLGRVDTAGNLFLVDRTKEVIIRGGYNVYPREVEEALYAHPDVREAAVIGVPHETLGEEVAAFVVLEPGATPDADALRAFAAERVAAYKYPRRIMYCESLPKSPTGKVLKRALRELT